MTTHTSSSPSSSPSPGPSAPARVLTARSHEDVLAAVPVVLGFEPADSIVMLTFGGAHTFHARIDLPPPRRPEDLEEAVELLVEPAVRHRVRSVVLVVYSDDATTARRALRALERRFDRSGIAVALAMRADGSRCYARGLPDHGVPYDLAAHPFRVDSVLEGVVTHASREDLAATLRTDTAAADRVAAVLDGPPGDPFDVAACTSGHADRGTFLDDREVATVVRALVDPAVRDASWCGTRRGRAEAHVRLWSDVTRRTPEQLVAGPASVVALVAWLAGHGALAWCAIDRSGEADVPGSLASLVAELLLSATPPSSWEDAETSS